MDPDQRRLSNYLIHVNIEFRLNIFVQNQRVLEEAAFLGGMEVADSIEVFLQ
ncbi:hypothetical protein CK203_100601 [Vitis vinifera]|uniref:Uncharacterized protein n=1 Tax=Vitis vinifera TaxID=29760 RepID=A0A438FIM5_VITVI|nr:hypothetical protein CK203_100601 [Vitis vinifera]